MININAMTLNGVIYELVPDTDKEKKIFEETASAGNCHNYCALAHVCKQLVDSSGALLCHDVFLKHNVHFEVKSICV